MFKVLACADEGQPVFVHVLLCKRTLLCKLPPLDITRCCAGCASAGWDFYQQELTLVIANGPLYLLLDNP